MPSLCVCNRNLYDKARTFVDPATTVGDFCTESFVKDFDLYVLIVLFRLHP
jgi:hypothetical protein